MLSIGALGFLCDANATAKWPTDGTRTVYYPGGVADKVANLTEAAQKKCLDLQHSAKHTPKAVFNTLWLPVYDPNDTRYVDAMNAAVGGVTADVIKKTSTDLLDKILDPTLDVNTQDDVDFMYTIYRKFGSEDAKEGSIARLVYEAVGDGTRDSILPQKYKEEMLDEYSEALQDFLAPKSDFFQKLGYEEEETKTCIANMAAQLKKFKMRTTPAAEPEPESPKTQQSQITINIGSMNYQSIRYLVFQLQQNHVQLNGVDRIKNAPKPEDWDDSIEIVEPSQEEAEAIVKHYKEEKKKHGRCNIV